MLENKVLFGEVVSGFAMRLMLPTELHLLILEKQKIALHAHKHINRHNTKSVRIETIKDKLLQTQSGHFFDCYYLLKRKHTNLRAFPENKKSCMTSLKCFCG